MDNQAIVACIQQPVLISNRSRISSVGSLLDCRAGGHGFDSQGRTKSNLDPEHFCACRGESYQELWGSLEQDCL